MKDQVVSDVVVRENIVEKLSVAGTQVGAWGSVFAWFASNESAVVFGILIGVLGLLINLFFAWRRDRRETRAHEMMVEKHKPLE
jgi:hypothetical protein